MVPWQRAATTYDKPTTVCGNMLVMGVVRQCQINYADKEDAQRSFVVQRKAP